MQYFPWIPALFVVAWFAAKLIRKRRRRKRFTVYVPVAAVRIK